MLSYTPDSVGLYNLCVDAKLRDRGIGSSIVRELLGFVLEPGKPMVLQCEPVLADWYVRFGFREVGLVTAYCRSNQAAGDILNIER
jgi:ribosomal protein S18 acetylase RimI-like enzyme